VSWAEYLLLAVAAIFWPLLFAVVLVALRTRQPARVLAAFLAAGLLTTIAVGCAIVFGLQDVSIGQRTVRAPVYLAAGVLSLAAASYVRHRPPSEPKRSSAERYVSRPRVAFVAGVVLNLFPGFVPFVALVDIAQTSYSTGAKAALVALFYVIMFSSVEVPLLCYGFAPDRTAAVVAGLNEWLSRNGRRLTVRLLALVGAYLLARGALLIYA
jgi:Sap, sulfolipid-1-addressing protein